MKFRILLKQAAYSLALLGAGLWAGWYFFAKPGANSPPRAVALREGGYAYINPLLLCLNSPGPTEELASLSKSVSTFAAPFENNKTLTKFSFYFNDMTGGQWTGINQNDTYDPASLLKLPILIAYLKQAESDPGLLSRKILYTGEPSTGTFYTLRSNTEYTVEELLNAMIEQSDNSAKDLLLKSINANNVVEIFSDLGVMVNQDPAKPYTISARDYGRFFRILYNATYANRDLSEKGMEMLTKATFQDGIVAGIPSGTPVAHKFGQYAPTPDVGGARPFWELHDCGIVYHPQRPYLLCVMTQGRDLDALKQVIQGVSRITYQTVDANYQ